MARKSDRRAETNGRRTADDEEDAKATGKAESQIDDDDDDDLEEDWVAREASTVEALSEAIDRVLDQARELESATADKIRAHPLATVLIAAAVGAIAAKLLEGRQ